MIHFVSNFRFVTYGNILVTPKNRMKQQFPFLLFLGTAITSLFGDFMSHFLGFTVLTFKDISWDPSLEAIPGIILTITFFVHQQLSPLVCGGWVIWSQLFFLLRSCDHMDVHPINLSMTGCSSRNRLTISSQSWDWWCTGLAVPQAVSVLMDTNRL